MDERLEGVQHIRDLIETGYILAEEHASVALLCAYVDTIEAESAALRERLRALVWADLSGLHKRDGVTFCAYCVHGEVLHDGEPFDHAPDCPIVLARQALDGSPE